MIEGNKERMVMIRSYPFTRLLTLNCDCGSASITGITYKDDYDGLKFKHYTVTHDCYLGEKTRAIGHRVLERAFDRYQVSERKAALTLAQWNAIMREPLPDSI